MLTDDYFSKNFYAEVVNIACYVTTRFLIKSILNKTPCELLYKRNPKLSYLGAFGSKYFLSNNDKDDLEKFNSKSDARIFVEYL